MNIFINKLLLGLAYQKTGHEKIKGMFKNGLKSWEVVCVRKGIYDILFHRAIGGSKYYPRPTLFFSVLFVSFEWIHLSLVHLFEAISGDTDL